MSRSRFGTIALLLVAACGLLTTSAALSAQRGAPPATVSPSTRIDVADLRRWLTDVASDDLQGREVFQEGLGLAATYLADQLRALGVEPAGEDGSYFQPVRVLGIRNTGVSSVTVTVKGQSRTFRDGEGVRFPKGQGGRQTVSGDAVFIGYGVEFAPLKHDDYAGRDVSGKVAVHIGRGPQGITATQNRLLFARSRTATFDHRAVAAIGAETEPPGTPAAPPRNPDRQADFQSAADYERPQPPQVTADDEFLRFVFSASGSDYDDLKAKAERRESLPRVSLADVHLRFDIRPDYTVVQTRLTRNVLGRVRGAEPALRDSWVILGAHYDHVGYAEFAVQPNEGAFTGICPGQTRPTPAPGDRIFNGADDDGTGTVALLAIAKAYARGPKPKRSVLFVWHAGEEAGLYGSRYMADHPVVPLDRVSAQLNVDMIGRNQCDNPAEANVLYLVGSDRISSELHATGELANAASARPMTLDYSYNDPADMEQLYYRSDHFSYAARGVPVTFFTTGLHRDYHYVTDDVSRIDFAKMTRVTSLIYDTSWRIANLDHLLTRDNRGPRAIRRVGR